MSDPAADQTMLAIFRSSYGRCLMALDRMDEAERHLQAAVTTLATAMDQGAERFRKNYLEALGNLASYYERNDQTDKAERYRALLAELDAPGREDFDSP